MAESIKYPIKRILKKQKYTNEVGVTIDGYVVDWEDTVEGRVDVDKKAWEEIIAKADEESEVSSSTGKRKPQTVLTEEIYYPQCLRTWKGDEDESVSISDYTFKRIKYPNRDCNGKVVSGTIRWRPSFVPKMCLTNLAQFKLDYADNLAFIKAKLSSTVSKTSNPSRRRAAKNTRPKVSAATKRKETKIATDEPLKNAETPTEEPKREHWFVRMNNEREERLADLAEKRITERAPLKYFCKDDNYTTSRWSDLKRHLWGHLSFEERLLKCKCGLQVSKYETVKRHRKLHM